MIAEFIYRLKQETPPWFKKIRKISLVVTAVGTALILAQSTITGFHLPDVMYIFCQWSIISGVTATTISQSATKEDEKKN